MNDNILKEYPDIFDQPSYQYSWPTGWDSLVNQLIKDVVAVSSEIKVLQIKEKFASLRFYFSNGNEEISRLVDEAENRSCTMCQECGSLGIQRNRGGWLSVRCDNCV